MTSKTKVVDCFLLEPVADDRSGVLYEGKNGVTTLEDAEPGAMWFMRGDLHVRLPNGYDWNVDGPTADGDGWTRAGEPPNVTAKPSIGMPWPPEEHEDYYHGWLRDGQLIET